MHVPILETCPCKLQLASVVHQSLWQPKHCDPSAPKQHSILGRHLKVEEHGRDLDVESKGGSKVQDPQ